MTTHVLTLSARTSNVMMTSVTTKHFFFEILSTLKAIENSFERSYDKQNITLMVISLKFIKRALSYEMTTSVIFGLSFDLSKEFVIAIKVDIILAKNALLL